MNDQIDLSEVFQWKQFLTSFAKNHATLSLVNFDVDRKTKIKEAFWNCWKSSLWALWDLCLVEPRSPPPMARKVSTSSAAAPSGDQSGGGAGTAGNKKIPVKVSAEVGSGVSELYIKYDCNYCQEDIPGLRVKCADCPDFDLCLPCFGCGAQIGKHKNTHKYLFMNNGGFPIFPRSVLDATRGLMLRTLFERKLVKKNRCCMKKFLWLNNLRLMENTFEN